MQEFDRVKIGDRIGVDMVREISQQMINRWAEISVDFNPLHVDREYGKSSRFGSTICHGTLTITYILEMLTLWMGKGWLEGGQLSNVRFKAPVFPGDTLRPKGSVVNKFTENDKKYIECDVWLENQDGVKVITGRARGEANSCRD